MRQTKKRQDIKSKLIAAICMLMVSVIMLASSSYAWFTLSTAPEVKGIQTAVGANGNLEIALLGTANSYNSPNGISSAVGDSSAAEGKSPITANLTWGNLIDLSHESYGLGLITLKPAKLMSTNNQISGQQILAVPLYGADGRVTEVTAGNTIIAPFDNSKKSFIEVDPNAEGYDAAKTIEYGLRAVGSSTNRSAREMAFDTYMSKGALAASQAKTAAGNSLNAYGGFLANMGIAGASDANATFTAADVAKLQEMLNSITGYDTFDDKGVKTGHTKGVADYIQDSLTNYSIAVMASTLNGTPYTDDAAFTTAMAELAKKSAVDIAAEVNTYAPQELKNAATALTKVLTTAAAAQSSLNGLTGESFTWNQIKGVVGTLFDASKMTLCGMTLTEVRDEGNPDDPTSSGLVKLQTAMQEKYNNQLVAEMTGGIYSEIADLTDGFSGSAYLTVQGMTVKAVMQANKTSTARYLLGQTNAVLATAGAPAGTSSVSSISDAYAYIVDMAFRTNAANSKLLLQTAADQRIENSSDDTTLGGGSNMTFTSVDGFSTADMKDLMKHIKVVFFLNSGETQQILATAGLDTANATVSGNDVTADLKIISGNGFATQENAVIYNMPTNTAVKISALVYLDGESITNADVGTGTQSMSGRMNLQFSSSANLTPMDYSAGFAPANPVPDATVETTTP